MVVLVATLVVARPSVARPAVARPAVAVAGGGWLMVCDGTWQVRRAMRWLRRSCSAG